MARISTADVVICGAGIAGVSLAHELACRRGVPRDLPLMIWTDPQRLKRSEEERRDLANDPALAWLLDELPGGAAGGRRSGTAPSSPASPCCCST